MIIGFQTDHGPISNPSYFFGHNFRAVVDAFLPFPVGLDLSEILSQVIAIVECICYSSKSMFEFVHASFNQFRFPVPETFKSIALCEFAG